MNPIVKHSNKNAQDVGKVLVSYLHNDKNTANAIIAYLKRKGISVIPEVPEKYHANFIGLVEYNLSNFEGVKCGVVIVNNQNKSDRRINFEIGMLASKEIKILPFCIDGILPRCISSMQYSSTIEQLYKNVQLFGNEYGNLYGDCDSNLNQVVTGFLGLVNLTIDIKNVPFTLKDYLKFGYQIISFGQHIEFGQNIFDKHCYIISKEFFTEKVDYGNIDDRLLNVTFSIPVHNKIGVTFKLFVDSPNWLKVTEIYEILKLPENNAENDVSISDSAEKQRVYFLIPSDDENMLEVLETPEGIKNNFIKPNVFYSNTIK